MKAQYKMMADIFFALLVVGICIAIYFAFIGYYIIIKGIVKDADEERKALNLGQIIISSDLLAYSDQNKTYRAILDESKLDAIDSKKLFEEINYPSYEYFLTINNSESGKSWVIGSEFSPKVRKSFPVAIKSGNEIDVGKITINFREKKK